MSKRRGRPRKEGVERGETGRIKSSVYTVQQSRKSAQQDADARALGRWRAARAIVETLLPDTRLATPLGKMLLLGAPFSINEAEFEAGSRLFKIMERYDRIFLGVGRTAKAQDIGAERGSALTLGPDPWLIEKIVADYRAAEAAFFKISKAEVRLADGTQFACGPGADIIGATKALVRGEDWERRAGVAIVGLKALARHWGLDEVPKAKIRRWGARLEFQRVDRVNSFEVTYE